MPVTDFNIWNPACHINVASGAIPSDELRARLLKISYVDRSKQYDHIEMEMLNSDGLLTLPQYLAPGMILRIKMGYLDATFPWKAFIINRVSGGMGVANNAERMVGDQEQTVLYHGRNRNAPGGKNSVAWRLRAKAPAGRYPGEVDARGRKKKPRKLYGPTGMPAELDALLGTTKQPQYINGKTTSEIVVEIARRNRFVGASAKIQPTNDNVDGAVIKPGQSDMEFLQILAERQGFVCEIRDDTLHWHGETWLNSVDSKIVETLWYAGGPDTTGLSMDMDFRLPLPSAGKAKFIHKERGTLDFVDAPVDAAKGNISHSRIYLEWANNPTRSSLLMRDEVGPIIADNIVHARDKMTQAFIRKHLRAFQLTHKGPGNPRLRARALVKIKGLNNPIIDGIWQIGEARHDLDSSGGYDTTIKLKKPAKGAAVSSCRVDTLDYVDHPYDAKKGVSSHVRIYYQRAKTTPAIK